VEFIGGFYKFNLRELESPLEIRIKVMKIFFLM
jgi:hypothetical protein